MPGSVVAANPVTVLPYSLAIAFQEEREVAVNSNRYLNGEASSAALAATSRKRFQQTKRLTAAQLAALRTFYLARGGGLQEFYFYDVYATVPIFSYDETGAAITGRYAVRFDGSFEQTLEMGRDQARLALIEVS